MFVFLKTCPIKERERDEEIEKHVERDLEIEIIK
jgi:hypothetical protein